MTKKENPIRLNIVIVGDGAVGKTSLLQRYIRNYFPDFYIPTVLEPTQADITVNNRYIILNLIDTAGQDSQQQGPDNPYLNADAVVICFSTTSNDSLDNVEEHWVHQIKQFRKRIPFVLVCTQIDLREDDSTTKKTGEKPLSYEDGDRIAKKIGAYEYVECSAKTGAGVQKAFETVARAAIAGKRNHSLKKMCCIL